jgi:WD40 repeat protein
VYAVALSSDGRHAVSGSEDNTLRWWDLHSGRCEAIFPCDNPVLAVACGRDPASLQPIVVAGLADGQVQFFHIENA